MAIYIGKNKVSLRAPELGAKKFKDLEDILLCIPVSDLLKKSWDYEVQDYIDPTFRDTLEEAEFYDKAKALQDAMSYQLLLVNARIEDSLRATRGLSGLPKGWPELAKNFTVQDGFLCWNSADGSIGGEVDLTASQEARLAAVC